MTFHYSDSKEIDCEELLKLQLTAHWCAGRTKEKIQKMIDHSQLLVTCWEGRQLLGCARVLSDYVFRAVVFDVIVLPDFQSVGIAKGLLDHVISHPSLQGVEYFFLYTASKENFYHQIRWNEYPGKSFWYMSKPLQISASHHEGVL